MRTGLRQLPCAPVLVAASAVACLSCGDGSGGSGTPSGGGVSLGESFEGEGTYYDANGDGNCMFGPSDDLDVAALNAEQYAGAAYCGACADVTGPDGTVRVRIVDQCPECAHGDLDFSESAFAQIAEPSLGRVPITWEVVSCDVAGPLEYQFKDGSSQWWVQLQIRNHRYPIAKLEWSADGETFTEMPRMDHNYFEESGGFGDRAVTLRITASTGDVVSDEVPPAEDSLHVVGNVQFE